MGISRAECWKVIKYIEMNRGWIWSILCQVFQVRELATRRMNEQWVAAEFLLWMDDLALHDVDKTVMLYTSTKNQKILIINCINSLNFKDVLSVPRSVVFSTTSTQWFKLKCINLSLQATNSHLLSMRVQKGSITSPNPVLYKVEILIHKGYCLYRLCCHHNSDHVEGKLKELRRNQSRKVPTQNAWQTHQASRTWV